MGFSDSRLGEISDHFVTPSQKTITQFACAFCASHVIKSAYRVTSKIEAA
jgi:hypothetical protein